MITFGKLESESVCYIWSIITLTIGVWSRLLTDFLLTNQLIVSAHVQCDNDWSMSCPSPLQVNQIHSSTGRHQGPQGSRDLWILRYFKSCSYCSVHLHTKVRVSTPLCVLRFLFCWTSCEVLCISVDNMLTAILLFPQECGYSAFLSKAFLLWKSDLKKTGLFELLLFFSSLFHCAALHHRTKMFSSSSGITLETHTWNVC